MIRKIAAVAAVMAFMLHPAIAQSTKGPNGGMLAGKAGHQMELVVSPADITVYLIDNGKPHSTKGVSLRAVVQQGGKTTNMQLTAHDDTRLGAKLAAPLAKGAIVVLSGKDDHGDGLTARFVID